MSRFRVLLLGLGLVFTFTLSAAPVEAQGIWDNCTGNEAICGSDTTEASGIVKNLINAFLFVVGMLAVAMAVHSGFKFVNSRGNPESIKAARETLLYAVIGIVVAVLAFTIVNFVLDIFGTTEGG